MATAAASSLLDANTHARRWIADYCQQYLHGDVLCAAQADPAWTAVLEELAAVAGDNLGHARERAQRHAEDIGTGFRIIGESDERPWPVSPVPLLIESDEWAHIAAGVRQRAELMETLLVDLYDQARYVETGLIPAALVG
ncbi:MAG: circularly permuted type 2 ATP-grasp protein, partial [Pseudomonadota bacterium]|nr:circularly permuted type 2 ATP-grasp protein [Pseudomonadota bacterium]